MKPFWKKQTKAIEPAIEAGTKSFTREDLPELAGDYIGLGFPFKFEIGADCARGETDQFAIIFPVSMVATSGMNFGDRGFEIVDGAWRGMRPPVGIQLISPHYGRWRGKSFPTAQEIHSFRAATQAVVTVVLDEYERFCHFARQAKEHGGI